MIGFKAASALDNQLALPMDPLDRALL